ncbi:hypothetical protein DEO72_LG1g2272 [Vigna unguiculata]|uniref:Uncharacterized protein n=1 Tax=Vigna unguiculata TaxID=3917 RepID=A0A4D6KKT9_VIGUN|nr:hypothetical protein DEO72_LG1g2272 [Vigna unguiculata]
MSTPNFVWSTHTKRGQLKNVLSQLAPLRLYASPDPPATSTAPVYRVHDHRQTQADRVS